MRRNRLLMVATGGLVAVVMAASAAWACTEQAYLATQAHSGAAGSAVTVTASRFNDAPIEIRWGTATGPVVASGQGPTLDVTFNVPADAAARVHYIVAVQPGSPNPSTPFKVTATAAASPTTDSPSPADPAPPSADPAASSSPQDAAAEPTVSPAPPVAAAVDASAAGRTSPVASQSSPGSRATPNRTTPAAPAAAPPASNTPSGSPAVVSTEQVPVQAPSSEEATTTASPRSISGDVWSGFAVGGDPSAGPSLDTRLSATSSPVPVLAAVLLTVGLFGLTAGFGVAGLQRRRVRSTRSS